MSTARKWMIVTVVLLCLALCAICVAAYFTAGFRGEKTPEQEPLPLPTNEGFLELSYNGAPVSAANIPDKEGTRIDVETSSNYTVKVMLVTPIAIETIPGAGASVLNVGDYSEHFNILQRKDYFLIDTTKDLLAIVERATGLALASLVTVAEDIPYFKVVVTNQDGLQSEFYILGYHCRQDIDFTVGEEVTIG